jgi:hypothetical protein
MGYFVNTPADAARSRYKLSTRPIAGAWLLLEEKGFRYDD